MTRDEQVNLIAQRFTEVLRNWLTADEFIEMKRKNETEAAYAAGACASHDFCDANIAMHDAFESVIGRSPLPDKVEMTEDDCILWNDAWNLARKLYLGTPHQCPSLP